MPSGFDFCPVCGQDQRERWRRPPTQQLQIRPGSGDQAQAPAVSAPAASMTVPAPGADPMAVHPAMHSPFGALVQAPSGPGGPAQAAAPGRSPDHTVPAAYVAVSPSAAAAPPDRTVPSPSMGVAPSAAVMPAIVADAIRDDDATVPAMGPRGVKSFEDAAFGASGAKAGGAAPDLDESKTIPFISLQQQQALLSEAGPSLTIPALFVSKEPVRSADQHTRPDRPGGFSHGPTGEAPPDGVNVPQRTQAPVAPAGPPGTPVQTYPGMAPARLVLVSRDGTEGESFPFRGETITVGRTHGDILFPEDPFLSPVHVRITRVGDGIQLTDPGSTNGVYLRIATVAPVYPGDMFMIGHQLLRLDQLDSQAQEHPPGVDGTRLFGTPLQPAWGRVSQLGRGGVAGDHMYLRGSRVSFGREGGDLVFPNDPFVSREHARLRLEINGQAMTVFLEDVGSANGTYVRIRGAAEIAAGDTFRVGDQILKLRLD